MVIICFSIKYFLGAKLASIGIRTETKLNEESKETSSQFEKPYDKMMHNFEYEYNRCNPVTSESSTREYLEWMKENGFKVKGKFFQVIGESVGRRRSSVAHIFLERLGIMENLQRRDIINKDKSQAVSKKSLFNAFFKAFTKNIPKNVQEKQKEKNILSVEKKIENNESSKKFNQKEEKINKNENLEDSEIIIFNLNSSREFPN